MRKKRSYPKKRGGPTTLRPGIDTLEAKETPAGKEKVLRTSRGTSMGGKGSAKERAAVGLNPVAGLDIDLEDAASLPASAVTATAVQSCAAIQQSRASCGW